MRSRGLARDRRYSGRKSCPHCETQWASSMARTLAPPRARAPAYRRARAVPARHKRGDSAPAASPPRSPHCRSALLTEFRRRRRDAPAAQLLHLIAHQGDQRRNHDGEARPDDRRQLVAQRFAGAGRHHGEDVLAGENSLQNLCLARPEVGKAEAALQRHAGVDHVVVQEAPDSRMVLRRAIAFLRPPGARMANEMSRPEPQPDFSPCEGAPFERNRTPRLKRRAVKKGVPDGIAGLVSQG